jgi:hypothetical protein
MSASSEATFLEYKTSIKYLSSTQESRNKNKDNWEERLTRNQNEVVSPCYWIKQSLVYQMSLTCCDHLNIWTSLLPQENDMTDKREILDQVLLLDRIILPVSSFVVVSSSIVVSSPGTSSFPSSQAWRALFMRLFIRLKCFIYHKIPDHRTDQISMFA